MGAGVIKKDGGGGRRRRGGRGKSHAMSEINVTPMVDVMLVLLIIFMVAAPMLTVGVPLELPKTAADYVYCVGQDYIFTCRNASSSGQAVMKTEES